MILAAYEKPLLYVAYCSWLN